MLDGGRGIDHFSGEVELETLIMMCEAFRDEVLVIEEKIYSELYRKSPRYVSTITYEPKIFYLWIFFLDVNAEIRRFIDNWLTQRLEDSLINEKKLTSQPKNLAKVNISFSLFYQS